MTGTPEYFFPKAGACKDYGSKVNSAKYIVKKGNIFGELSLYDKKAGEEEQAIALEDCIVCYIESNTDGRLNGET